MRRTTLLLSLAVVACGGSDSAPGPVSPTTSTAHPAAPPTSAPAPTYDVDVKGIPRFAGSSHIDIASLDFISRFRSGFGHDYHDAFESCRSMKHYFQPRGGVDWSTLAISSPVDGRISSTRVETTFGTQVLIRSTEQPAFTFILFHVRPTMALDSGTVVKAGQQIGFHAGSQTLSDLAVGVDTPTGYKLVSWFDVVTDSLFGRYAARGIATRSSAVIPSSVRDASPLTCDGETFASAGTLENWMMLR